ncbi:thermonuclease family protein [Vibrio sonorensis]|uniref:thermonuclease family protein n=1 Tax=Vibrio sonorensis TaxID=1004316 RepID=UPI001FDF2760|nr:thermonuclease family protein [Vibrio sonorensis]
MKSYVKNLIAILLLVCFCLPASAKKTSYGDVMVAAVVSVYDADTFRVNIQGWPDVVGQNISIRVMGVDAPEIRGKCEAEKIAAKEAKAFTKQALARATKIELKNIRRGKYFRLLADVYLDDQSLSQALINQGLAVPYNGGKRINWCKRL